MADVVVDGGGHLLGAAHEVVVGEGVLGPLVELAVSAFELEPITGQQVGLHAGQDVVAQLHVAVLLQLLLNRLDLLRLFLRRVPCLRPPERFLLVQAAPELLTLAPE